MEKYTEQSMTIQMPSGTTPPMGCLVHPSGLSQFTQEGFSWELKLAVEGKTQIREIPAEMMQDCLRRLVTEAKWVVTECYRGTVIEKDREVDRLCPYCGHPMHKHTQETSRLQHLPSGHMRSVIEVTRPRFKCPNEHCPQKGKTVLLDIPFQTPHHRITLQLHNYIESLCEYGYTQTEIAELTGANRHTVRAIDKARLENIYTEVAADGKRVLRQPKQQAAVLGIDEFKLHNGHEYATLIMDMDTGHILWLQHSRKKQVVYDFIDYVGLDWMKGVKAVCSDMNADFAAAFRERCPHLEIVYDRFHLVKNFNDMVVSEVRKDEYKRLMAEGDRDGARFIKGSRYILFSNRSTLQKKDAEAAEDKVLRSGSELFRIPQVSRSGGKEEWYDKILEQNELLFMADYVKELLNAAYQQADRSVMQMDMQEIVAVCRATENRHFEKFANLIENHLDGITAHADYPRSSGKIEGTNNRIKTIRRRAYGYRDDTYFFLKIMDASRHRPSRS